MNNEEDVFTHDCPQTEFISSDCAGDQDKIPLAVHPSDTEVWRSRGGDWYLEVYNEYSVRIRCCPFCGTLLS